MTFKFLELDGITWVTEPRKTSMRKTKSNRSEKEEDEETAETLGQPRECYDGKQSCCSGPGVGAGVGAGLSPHPLQRKRQQVQDQGSAGLRTVGENLFEVSLLVSGYLLADTSL